MKASFPEFWMNFLSPFKSVSGAETEQTTGKGRKEMSKQNKE